MWRIAAKKGMAIHPTPLIWAIKKDFLSSHIQKKQAL
jgi:hypothetical protein